jgi:hypothetical protein
LTPVFPATKILPETSIVKPAMKLPLALICVGFAVLSARPAVRAFQQTPPAAPSGTVVLGRVMEDGKSTPVARALVIVSRTTEPYHTQSALTDDNGRFVFFNLPAGSYYVRSEREGYWGGELGQLRPNGRRSGYLVIENGQRIADGLVPVWRMASVSGTVRDDLGEPVVGVIVQAFGVISGGGRLLISSGWRSIKTDDRGMYRLYALPPGEYAIVVPTASLANLVSALPATGDPAGELTYPPVFHPGLTPSGFTSMIALQAGEERPGVDLRLQMMRSRRVSGRVTGAPSVSGVTIKIVRRVPLSWDDISIADTRTRSDGSFSFERVPPGEYSIAVFEPSAGTPQIGFEVVTNDDSPRQPMPRTRPGSTGWWTDVPITVADAHLSDVEVPLQPTMRIKGRVVFEGTAPKPQARELYSVLSPTVASGRRIEFRLSEADPNFEFRTTELPGGQYFLRSSGALQNWFVDSITVGGRDAVDQPIELRDADVGDVVVTLTDKPSELTGVVRLDTGAPDHDAIVLVFPVDPARRIDFGRDSPRLRETRSSVDGRYTLRGLPAGEYFVAALNDAAMTDLWQTQAFTQRLSLRATKVSVTRGQKQVLDLKTAKGR